MQYEPSTYKWVIELHSNTIFLTLPPLSACPTVRVHTQPPSIVAGVAPFPTLRECAKAVIAIEHLR